MKYIKNYSKFINESLISDIKIDITELLNILTGKKINIFSLFSINKDSLTKNSNISVLYNNTSFNSNIDKKGLKKSKLEDTSFFETLLKDNYKLMYFFIHSKDNMTIEEPIYIVLQYYDRDNDKLSEIICFTNENNVGDFYNKLTNYTLEIERDGKSRIYSTSNSGNDWSLKNPEDVTNKLKQNLDSSELDKLIKRADIKVK